MVRCTCCALGAWLFLGLGGAVAQVRAQPGPTFDPPPSAQAPIRLPEPTAPVMRADPAAAPLSSAGVNRQALRMPAADNPALDAELARLRAAALAPARAGQRGNRDAATASWVLGLLYMHGIGVAISLGEAADWFARARTGGEPLAAAGLAWCEIEGCKVPPNPQAAQRWINELRKVNLPRAQYLQWLLQARMQPLQIASPSGTGPNQAPPDNAALRGLLLSAAQAGDVQARIELGFQSMAADRPDNALSYFRAAAPQSTAAAGNVALLAEPATRDRQASPTAAGASTLAQAQRNHRGDRQPANFVEAIRLYRLAQNQGSEQARKMLELIFSRPGPDGSVDIAWMQQLAYVNLSQDVAQLESSTDRRNLRRDPTPLFDLLPPVWQKTASQAPR